MKLVTMYYHIIFNPVNSEPSWSYITRIHEYCSTYGGLFVHLSKLHTWFVIEN